MYIYLALFLVFLTYILLNYIKQLTYWRSKGVKYVTPVPLLGNLWPVVRKTVSMPGYSASLYKAFPEERYCGIYQLSKPILLLRDPELIKRITIQDFDSFTDHITLFSEDADPVFAKTLFGSEGTRWRNLRHTLTHIFTGNKLKLMYVLIDDCVQQFIDYLNDKNEEIVELELYDIIRRFTMDAVATTVFGVQCDSLRDRNNEFFRMGEDLSDFSGIKRFKLVAYSIHPYIKRMLNWTMFSDKTNRYFSEIIKQTMETRIKENIYRPDFINLFIELKKGKNLADDTNDKEEQITKENKARAAPVSKMYKEFAMALTDEDICAQAIIFIFGGYESTATLIMYCIYELVANPEIQEKLRREIDEAFENFNGKISYEELFKLKYLDMVISETLRLWPIAIFADRQVVRPFTIEPKLKHEKSVHLEPGDACWIPIFPIQRDPKYWSNPDKFDPERFNEENRQKIISSTYLPFGLGPRTCIGMRYTFMKSKLLIFYLLAYFEIVPTKKTQIPFVISKNNILCPEGGIWVGFKRRQTLKKKK